jgi:hypothetical protein
MPTQGTHNPDVPYVACSDAAWGPKGSEHMKTANDMEYEEKVANPFFLVLAIRCKMSGGLKKHGSPSFGD